MTPLWIGLLFLMGGSEQRAESGEVTAVYQTIASPRRVTFNVQNYGATGESSHWSTQGSMKEGSETLNCSDCEFTKAEIGKKVYVYGATNAPHGLSLGSIIQRVLSSSHVELADRATQSTSGALVQIIGADDTKAIFAARETACAAAKSSGAATLLFPNGVYTLDEPLAPCSDLHITGTGTVLQTGILAGAASGQGASVVVFPKSPTGRWCNGGTMRAGSDVLEYGRQGDTPCNFSPGDTGSNVVALYAGKNHLPLYATIKRYVSATEVVLNEPAQTAVPVTDAGFGKVGTYLQIGTTAIANVELDGLTLMNVSTAYPIPGRTLGSGIVALGADNTSLKQNIRIHDLTVITASNNCLGGINGFLDQYQIEHNMLIGCADASIYVAGGNSAGTVSNNTITNTTFPGLSASVMASVLVTGIYIKNASNVTFADNAINLNVGHAGIAFGDHPQSQDQVVNNTITVSSEDHNVVGISGNVGDRVVVRGNHIKCQTPRQGLGILFYSSAVTNIEATGNVIQNCKAAIVFGGIISGPGPIGVTIKDNYVSRCTDGVTLDSIGGVNVIKNNKLTACSGRSWVVRRSQIGAVTYFHGDNETDSAAAGSNFDNSVRRVP